MKPEIELVTTGAELLNGCTVNRHAQWFGLQLFQIGWTLTRDTTVVDDPAAIRDAILSAFQRTSVVVVTGGLGPTSDDVTRDVAAAWFGTKIIMHEPSRLAVVRSYQKRNKPLNDTVERHALVVEGAEVLENHHGLAAGEHLEKNGKHLFLLPGPPREFHGMTKDHVIPWLDRLAVAGRFRLHVFQTAGLGESDIMAKLEHEGYTSLNVDTAYCAEPGRVSIRVREKINAANDFNQAVKVIQHALGRSVYSQQDETIEHAVGRLLKERGRTIAVAESCTGGMIGQRLTAIPGSSAYVRGGVIAYHNDVKAGLLHVDKKLLEQFGAVSEPVAVAMAEGVRLITGADIGLSVTGIAGPDGGTAEKPVGLVYIGIADSNGSLARELRLGGGRDIIRESSATMALDLVRTRLERR